MEISILLARMLSIYFIVIGLALLFNRNFYQTTLVNFFKNDAIYFLANLLALITGIILVTLHNLWIAAWPVIITIVAWFTLIKGAFRLLVPSFAMGWKKRVINNDTYYMICAIIAIVIGLILAYFGYFVGIRLV